MERGRDRQGGYRQGDTGGREKGRDIGELFDDLDYFLASARISTEVYATSKTGALGPEECRFGEIGESRSEQSARPRVAVPDVVTIRR